MDGTNDLLDVEIITIIDGILQRHVVFYADENHMTNSIAVIVERLRSHGKPFTVLTISLEEVD